MGRDVFHHVLVNDNFDVKLNPNTELVSLEHEAEGGFQVVSANLIDPQQPWRHDPQKLARSLMNFYLEIRDWRLEIGDWIIQPPTSNL